MSRPSFAAALVLAACAAVPAFAADAPRIGFADAVALAARQSTGVTLAELRRREADARIGQARAVFLPSVTAQATMVDRTFNILAMGIRLPGFRVADPLIGPVYDSEARLKVSQTVLDLASWQKLRGARLGLGQGQQVVEQPGPFGRRLAAVPVEGCEIVEVHRSLTFRVSSFSSSIDACSSATSTRRLSRIARARSRWAWAQVSVAPDSAFNSAWRVL